MNKNFLVLVVVVIIIAVSTFILQNDKKETVIGLGECVIENNILTCGRSYNLVTKGIEYDVESNTPFNLSNLPADSFLLAITEQKLYEKLSVLYTTDNPENLSNMERVQIAEDEFFVETGRLGTYFINKTDGRYILGEEQSAEAVGKQLIEIRE